MDTRLFFLIVLILVFSTCNQIQAQGKKPDSLFTQIARMDSVMFSAFNNRDITTFEKLFSKDLEFYHDKGGLTDYQHTVDFMKSTAASNNGLKRDLIPGSLEVYPIKDYGAIEIGSHRFCHQENGKESCSVFKFVHVWKQTTSGWQVTRVISYGH